jgi:hypothetical protein
MSNNRVRMMVYRHSAFYSPLLAAVAAGFLKDEGLEASYFVKPRDRNLYEMFGRDEVDVMQAAVSTSWDPLSKGVRDIPGILLRSIRRTDSLLPAGKRTLAFPGDLWRAPNFLPITPNSRWQC